MDPDAVNFSESSQEEDGSCMYSIFGVWETETATVNDQNIDFGEDLVFIFEDGSMGTRTKDNTGFIQSFSIGVASLTSEDPNILEWFGDVYEYNNDLGDYDVVYNVLVVVLIDKMINSYSMTFRYADYPLEGDIYVKTLLKSDNYILSDW